MFIEYDNTAKEVRCYRDFVQNPADRSATRAFSKAFGVSLMEPAKKLHDRLLRYPSAGAYNADFGRTDNRIELKQGCRDHDPLILKVRVGRGSRKFFNQIVDEVGNLLLKREWTGCFNSVTRIYVIAINNHDYNNI